MPKNPNIGKENAAAGAPEGSEARRKKGGARGKNSAAGAPAITDAISDTRGRVSHGFAPGIGEDPDDAWKFPKPPNPYADGALPEGEPDPDELYPGAVGRSFPD